MKFTILGFNQKKLLEYKLDGIDATILRWYVDFLPKMKDIIIGEEVYKWVKYQAIIDDIPTLGINCKKTIARRFEKLISAGIMQKCLYKSNGTYVGFKLTDKYLTLMGDEQGTQMSIAGDSNVHSRGLKCPTGVDSNVHTKDSSINNTPPLNPSIIIYNKWEQLLGKVHEQNTDAFKARTKTIEKALKEYSIDTLLNLVEYKLTSQYTQNKDISAIMANTWLATNISKMQSWLDNNKTHIEYKQLNNNSPNKQSDNIDLKRTNNKTYDGEF